MIGFARSHMARAGGFRCGRLLALLAIALLGMLPLCRPAQAMQVIPVNPDQDRIEITPLGDLYEPRGDNLQIETAAGADGIAGRMAVRAVTPGTSPSWIVFALQNPTDKIIERWLTAERYSIVGSGIVWPDLDARRIEGVTPSIGFVPDRIKSDRADIFRITLEPGTTTTFVAELSSDRFARVYLWRPIDYELKARDRQLFNGMLLGIVGVLGLFLTAIFAANHKAVFPSAALVAWCALAYLCVDFGFWHKLFQLRPEDNSLYRAAAEAATAASLVIFLHTFLRLGLWHGFIRMLLGVWIAAQLALIAVAVIDARLAATFARISFVAIGGIGGALTLFLALRGQDRALALVPTWILFLVWIFGASMTLTGRLNGDIFVSAVTAGLVLIIVLIGFTVTQFAFRSLEPAYGAAPSELQMRSIAIDGAGAAVWEWHARRDEIKVSAALEAALGLPAGELNTKVKTFLEHVHSADRERFRLTLWSVQAKSGSGMRVDFRMRHADNSYRWFDLEAASVPAADHRSIRCVGLLRDVTESKRAQERLMHDAVNDNLTGLPSRELFLDRLNVALARAKTEAGLRPTVLYVDIDRFKNVNSSFGLIVGDSLLLTISRRLARHLGPQDTLARVGGDQFAMLLLGRFEPSELARLADRIRHAVRSPIKIAGKDIVLTGSLGLAVYDGTEQSGQDLFKEAEIAMHRAKRGGSDRIELFRPEMRGEVDDRTALAEDLRRAIEKKQIRVLYQPIVHLATEELAGFEAIVRWSHPRLGPLDPADFTPVAEDSDLIVKLGSHIITQAAYEAARWQKELPRPDNPLFVSVDVSSRQLFRQDMLQELRHILGNAIVPSGCLQLEVRESLVMENPEQAVEVLSSLKGAGARLALDDFGTGFSSFTYLHRLPFDTIKIDRALVQAGAADVTGSTIVRSIVALARELDKTIVAEGVEVAEESAFLRSIGCHCAQGFYYGEPMAERDVLQLLKVIRGSERKLQRRGFFRTRPKRKDRPAAAQVPIRPSGTDRPTAAGDSLVASAVSAGTNGTQAPARPASLLPASTIRLRSRPAKPAQPDQSAAAGPRPPAPVQTQARPTAPPPPPALGLPPRIPPANARTQPPKAPPPQARPAPPAAPARAGDVPRTAPPARPPLPGPPRTANGRPQPEAPRPVPQPPRPAFAARPAPLPPQPLPPSRSPPAPVANFDGRAGSSGRPSGTVPNRPGAPMPPQQPPPIPRPAPPGLGPDYSNLPPAIRASLAKLAGLPPDTPSGGPPPPPKGRGAPPPASEPDKPSRRR